MKKFLAVLTLLALLLSMGTVAFANETEIQGYHSSLITHWDFEGEEAELYADKATAGASTDTLTVHGADIEVKNGVVYIPNTAGTYLSASGIENTDLYDFKNKTVVVKAALVNHADGRSGVAGFISKKNAFTYYLQNEDAGNASAMHVRVNNVNNGLDGEKTKMDEFRVFVMVMEYDEATKSLTAKYYMSTKEVPESAADFQLMVEQTVVSTTEDSVVMSAEDLVLGKRHDHTEKDRKLLTYFDDVKVYSEVLTLDEIAADCPEETEYKLGGDDEAVSNGNGTAAYQVGSEFVSYIQADDTKYVAIGTGNSWGVKEVAGAMDGKAIYCETKASNAAGDGITVTFFVPEEGDYTIWARAYYPTHSNNSMFYSIDGKGNVIWDFPDEDDTAKCYSSWQYFYLTERVTGTYSDTTQYGSWTIANGDWRHSPNTLHLTAGQHTIKITGREAGMYIDEFVVTSYSIAEYDPNVFDGNTCILEECKFCGSNWKHYYSDVYAQTEITAQTHFTTVLHTDATAWTIPEVTPDTPSDPTPSDPTPSDPTPSNPTPSDPEEEESTTADTGTTNPPEDKGGCGSSIGISTILVMIAAASSEFLIKRKKEK